jgi:pimeloyl-ACP methyl ester carboxylesterase
VTIPPFSGDYLKKTLTNIKTPTLSLIAEDCVNSGRYNGTQFQLDESHYPHGNYRVKIIKGGHDVHFEHPERLAGYVRQFLLKGVEGLDFKAKL